MPKRSGSAVLSTFRDRGRASRRSGHGGSRAALRLGLGQMTETSPNFVRLNSTQTDIANLVVAMLQARDAVERRSWSHPQEATGEAWWADVLADPRARERKRRTDVAVKQAFYMGSPMRSTTLSSSRAASASGGLRFRATTSWPPMVRTIRCPICSTVSRHRTVRGSARRGTAAGCITSSRSRAAKRPSSHHLDRAPCKLDRSLPTEQLKQDEHPLVRTQGTKQANLLAQRATNPHPHTRFEPRLR